ncbi:alpha-glucosidase/alpha-galactosidase [Planctomycetota bacterium]|nr:alpha-glucosidase/alpha-galactosidase [Planctomycetota bacterium]
MTSITVEVSENKTEQKELLEGHAAHTKVADSQNGLPGEILRPVNVVFLGAGSNFCPTLCKDILLIPGNKGGELRLVDINESRLNAMRQVIIRLISEMGLTEKWSVTATTEREKVLAGTHYVVCCVEVSGEDCVEWDNDIPLKYGIDQCIGDTIGPGGLFKGLRTVPVFLDILRDMREMCPKAVMLNYTNPMNMMVLAAHRAVPEIPVVGLCHSVQGTSHLLADYADVPYSELEWECAGINHLAWFTKLEHKGECLYESYLFDKFNEEINFGIEEAEQGLVHIDATDDSHGNTVDVDYKQTDLIRKDMCVQFGAFITESSGHLSEYLPYYRKNEEGRKLLRIGYEGGSRFYASNWPRWKKEADAKRERLVSGEEPFELERSWEYGSFIIESIEKDAPYRFHGNVINSTSAKGEVGKLITNLPGDGCVEVACYVDRNGIQPIRYGELPSQMAHICASNMAMFDLAANAIVKKDKEAAIHALMMDPLCQAVCSPREIRQMAEEMFEVENEYVGDYK